MPQAIIPLSDFDESLLPPGSPRRGTEGFPVAVSEYFAKEFAGVQGKVRIVVGPELIEIDWELGDGDEAVDGCVTLLQQGKYKEAVFLLRAIVDKQPNNKPALYNLGMALSDMGELEEAVAHLKHLSSLDNENANAAVALGVAFARMQKIENAIEELQRAVVIDDSNSFAHRNLGAMFLKIGDSARGLEHLHQAAKLDDSDARAWFGLGQAYVAANKPSDADPCFRRVIELEGSSDLGEAAKAEMRKMAHDTFRENAVAGERPDAVMYCLAALELLTPMSDSQVKPILFEIAMKGNSGFDINNPEKRYHFDSVKGDFSGLQAVCYMYVAGQRILPGQDMGIDLSKEYKQALSLFKK